MEAVRYADFMKTERFLKYDNNFIVRIEQQKWPAENNCCRNNIIQEDKDLSLKLMLFITRCYFALESRLPTSLSQRQ